jgi:hypothetical protein
MRQRLGLLVSVALLFGVAAITWSTVGDASASSHSPTEATYVTHLIGNPKNTSSWHAQEDISGVPGWYKFEVTSYAPSCWYAVGKGTLGWPGPAASGLATGFVEVLQSGASLTFKCANGSGAGEMFVTLVPTTMTGNPQELIGHRPRPKPCVPLHGLQRLTTICHPAYKAASGASGRD